MAIIRMISGLEATVLVIRKLMGAFASVYSRRSKILTGHMRKGQGARE